MRGLCVGECVDALLHRFIAPDFEVGVGRGAGDRVRGVAARMIEGFGAVGREMRCEDRLDAQRHRERERAAGQTFGETDDIRSEEHTSELQSLMRISYAVFCLKKKKTSK